MVTRDRIHRRLSKCGQVKCWSRLKGFMALIGFFLVALVPPSNVEALDISDEPLEVKILSAPANIMFVLDNSGSMDWEFMTDNTDGKFEGNIEYLFDDPGDNNYKPPDSNGTVLPVADRGKWKSQWSGHNKIFYNPGVDYYPWPTKPDADTSSPRSNPENATPTITLNDEYVAIGAVSVKNAHYYVWDDANQDGIVDNLEVYLVNFVGGTREYYQFNDDGDGVVEAGELISIAALPESITPKFKDELGNEIVKTDAEDLQNFANWVSFFRRRELTAKAAVAIIINGLQDVNVGFYSINPDLRQTVLPVKVDPAANIIVDNQDSRYQESGQWAESTAPNEYNDSSRYTRETGASATWTPDLPEAGIYNVYAWYDFLGTRDTNALYTINHTSGLTTVRVNQKTFVSQWRLIGTFQFDAGSSGSVTVTRDSQSTGLSTGADAVMFERVGGTGLTADETVTLLNLLFGLNSDGGTPLRSALKAVGQYYHQDDGQTGGLGASPFASSAEGGACQQAFAIVMTDGFYNGGSPNVGNQDGSEGPPYADAFSNTLADVAMKYYKEDLASRLADEVPTNACDRATHQHMVTYTVAFGATGTLTPPEDDPCFLDSATPIPVWPDPNSGDHEKIDDLWHAAVDGRGLFFSASPPEELIDTLKTLFKNLVARSGSGASVSVNSEQLNTSTVLYQGSYDSNDWTGDVTAYQVNPATGEVLRDPSDILWHASDQLQTLSPNNRKIVTYDGTSDGIPFRAARLTPAQKTALDSNWATDTANPTLVEKIVDYLRGREITDFRIRTRKLGDIVHSAPLLVGNTLFVGANDGMLHAFHAVTGLERFAYVPNLVFDHLALLKDNDYEHKFFVDLTPVAVTGVGDEKTTLLVGGLGKGGKGYYALNVTVADNLDPGSSEETVASMVLWEYPRQGTIDDDLGYTFSKAFIVRSYAADNEWVVIFGNGYDSTLGHAVLYVLDLQGNLIKKIDTGVGGDNGLSTPSLVDVNGDFIVDYAYAGDLKGNLWKFDLTDSDPLKWDSAYGADNNNDGVIIFSDGDVPQPLFQATDQPITTKPDVIRHCEKHGYIVVFGTGRYLNTGDRSSTDVQTLYGIWDYGDDADNSEFLGSFDRTNGTLSNQPDNITLLQQSVETSITSSGVEFRVLTDFTPNWETVDDPDGGQNPNPSPGSNVGWYFDLPSAGERIIKDPMIRDGRAIVVSTIPTDSPCSGGGNSFLYEVDACTGGRVPVPIFDIDYNYAVDIRDRINIGTEGAPRMVAPSGMGFSGILNPPIILRGPNNTEMKLFSSSSGAVENVAEVAEKTGIYYWIER